MESSIDRKIHRKLDRARTVYLTMGRGSNKIRRQLELYSELQAAKRKVVLVKGKEVNVFGE